MRLHANHPTKLNLENINEARREVHMWLEREELMWKQRYCLAWLNEGD